MTGEASAHGLARDTTTQDVYLRSQGACLVTMYCCDEPTTLQEATERDKEIGEIWARTMQRFCDPIAVRFETLTLSL
jgi:hypothetical protein